MECEIEWNARLNAARHRLDRLVGWLVGRVEGLMVGWLVGWLEWSIGGLVGWHGKEVHAVMGMYRDKDIEAVTAALAPLVKTWHLVEMSAEARAASAEEMARRLAVRHHGTASRYAKLSDAVTALRERVRPDDLMVVFGSFPLIADALELFDGEPT